MSIKPVIKTLPNGLKVCFLEDKNVDSVVVQLRGLAGSNYENLDNIGVAHFLEHWVLKDKTSLITQEGGKFIAVTSRDDVLFSAHVLKSQIDNALLFLSQIFYEPDLNEAKVPELRETIRNEISRFYDNPEKLLVRLSHQTLFNGQRSAKFNTGDSLDILKIQPAVVKDFYKKYYLNDRFVLMICGNFDIRKIQEIILKLFNKKTTNSQDKLKQITITNELVVKKFTNFSFEQDYVKIDLSAPAMLSKNKMAVAILAKYLTSKLKFVAHTNGWAYKTSVDYNPAFSYGILSMFAIVGEKGLNMLMYYKNQIESFEEYFDNKLFEQSKKAVTADIIFALEKVSNRANHYSELLLLNQSFDYDIGVYKHKFIEIAKEIFTKQPKITLLSKNNILTETNMWN